MPKGGEAGTDGTAAAPEVAPGENRGEPSIPAVVPRPSLELADSLLRKARLGLKATHAHHATVPACPAPFYCVHDD